MWHATVAASSGGVTSMARSHGCGGGVSHKVRRRCCRPRYGAANRLCNGQIGCKARRARLQGGGAVRQRGEGGEAAGQQGEGSKAARRG